MDIQQNQIFTSSWNSRQEKWIMGKIFVCKQSGIFASFASWSLSPGKWLKIGTEVFHDGIAMLLVQKVVTQDTWHLLNAVLLDKASQPTVYPAIIFSFLNMSFWIIYLEGE